MTTAAIYTRISRDFTGKKKGVERQEEDCRIMAQVKGWDVYDHVYSDNSISAYSGKEREEYDAMLADYRAGKFDVILAWKLDRLTRSVRGFAEMLDEITEQKLRICTTDLGDVDLSKADARFTTNILVSVAEFESARKSERTKRANLQRAQNGTFKCGTRGFGYDGDFNIIEKEAEVVRAIYSAYLHGATMSAITRAVSGETDELPEIPRSEAPSEIIGAERGKPPCWSKKDQKRNPAHKQGERKNLKWSLATTQQILRNPKYAGYIAYNPVINRKWHTPNSHWSDYIMRESDGTPVKAVWSPIVEPDIWWAVQRKRDANKFRKSDGEPINRDGAARKYFGSGVYRCGVCGAPLKSGDKSYRCDGHVNRMRNKVDEFVLAVIRERLAQPDLADILAQDDDPNLTDIDQQIATCRAEVARARDDYKAHRIDGELYQEITAEQRSEMNRLEERRLALLPQNPASSIAAAEDPVAAFDAITDPGQIANIINFFATVTLMPSQRGYRQTTERLRENVVIEWKK